MSDTKKYEVIRDNCLSCKIGDIIELTDSKASSLVNKVKLVEEKKAPKKADK